MKTAVIQRSILNSFFVSISGCAVDEENAYVIDSYANENDRHNPAEPLFKGLEFVVETAHFRNGIGDHPRKDDNRQACCKSKNERQPQSGRTCNSDGYQHAKIENPAVRTESQRENDTQQEHLPETFLVVLFHLFAKLTKSGKIDPYQVEHEDADDDQQWPQHALSPFLEEAGNGKSARTKVKDQANEGVGNSPPKGVDQAIDKNPAFVFNILADEGNGSDIGSQRTWAYRRHQAK